METDCAILQIDPKIYSGTFVCEPYSPRYYFKHSIQQFIVCLVQQNFIVHTCCVYSINKVLKFI